MHGFRRCSSRILALAAVCFLAPGMAALAETTDSTGGAPTSAGVKSDDVNAGRRIIQARIQELKELAISMDSIHANLVKVAEKALRDSDSAPTLTERRRYEQLYAETNTRLGELQTTRAEITRLLGELEAQVEAPKHAR